MRLTRDGLTIYDLDPQSSELWAVAGPAGWDVADIDPDDLPAGFRWVTDDEWEASDTSGGGQGSGNMETAEILTAAINESIRTDSRVSITLDAIDHAITDADTLHDLLCAVWEGDVEVTCCDEPHILMARGWTEWTENEQEWALRVVLPRYQQARSIRSAIADMTDHDEGQP